MAKSQTTELPRYRELYAADYNRAKNSLVKGRAIDLDMISPNSRYLDVSCGRGKMLAYVRGLNRGIECYGTEFVPELCGDNIINAALPELAGVEPADFVSCYEVLEHLPVHDVLPAIDRLFEVCRKMLIISTNDMPSMAAPGLHISRFPKRWWLEQLEARVKVRGGRLYERENRADVQRDDGPRRFWTLRVDFREEYQPFDFRKVHWHGYDSDMTPFWFFWCPAFPVAELQETPASTQFDLPHVKALHADLDKRGILNPLLVHNIPGQSNRRYWTRTGNHRRNWALARGIKAVPAIVYGGCEHYPCEALTLREANRKLRDGKLSFVANQPPNVIDVAPWDTTMSFAHL